MARKSISLDEKIQRQKDIVAKHKARYEASLTELETLLKEREAIRNKELLRAIGKSRRSYSEILEFLKGKDPDDD